MPNILYAFDLEDKQTMPPLAPAYWPEWGQEYNDSAWKQAWDKCQASQVKKLLNQDETDGFIPPEA